MATTTSRSTVTHFDSNSDPGDLGTIQATNGVLGIASIVILDKSKSRRISGDPNVTKGPILGERILYVHLRCILGQVTDVDFTVLVAWSGHDWARGEMSNSLSRYKRRQ